jgi:lysophospholipase L1-like esterase
MAAAEIASFVAMGDSFTAGAGCPDGSRWSDRLASALRRQDGDLVYRNLAVDGATSADVERQLEPALELEPDLVTLICGVNDVLLSVRPDVDGYAVRLGQMFERLKAAPRQPLVITATAPESLHFLGLGPRSERRVRSGLRRVNEHTRRLAADHDVVCLEVVGHPALDEQRYFQADGLHPSALGHARAAVVFESLLDRASIEMQGGRR